MKNLIKIFSLLALIFFTYTMDAQRSSRGGEGDVLGYDKAIKIGPLGFLFGSYNATFEKKLKENASFVVGGRFSNLSLLDTDFTNIALNAQYRLYFKEAIAGPYLAPNLGAGFNSGSLSNGDSDNFTNLRLGVNVGWQWITGGGFVVDLGIGAAYRAGFGDSINSDDFSGVAPAFQVQIGYAF